MKATEIQELGATFRGDLITPGDAAYEAARTVKRKYYPARLSRVNENIRPADA